MPIVWPSIRRSSFAVRRACGAAAALCGLLSATPAPAAGASGSPAELVIVVYVETPCLPVQAAMVVLDSPSRVAMTDSGGVSVLRDLPPGPRAITVTAAGRGEVRTTVHLGRGERVLLLVDLAAGAAVRAAG